jgi:hypothetical protein
LEMESSNWCFKIALEYAALRRNFGDAGNPSCEPWLGAGRRPNPPAEGSGKR